VQFYILKFRLEYSYEILVNSDFNLILKSHFVPAMNVSHFEFKHSARKMITKMKRTAVNLIFFYNVNTIDIILVVLVVLCYNFIHMPAMTRAITCSISANKEVQFTLVHLHFHGLCCVSLYEYENTIS
jgi:hypothetical protein